jgi:sugar lactone lactonase YvrE
MTRASALSLLAVPAMAAIASELFAWAAQQPPSLAPGTIITVVGNGKTGFSGDSGPASMAMLNDPLDQAFDASGNLFITDSHNNRVRKVSPDGTITTVVGVGPAGEHKGGFSGDGGPAVMAKLSVPTSVTVDTAGNLFISDGLNNRVRKVDPAGIITTVAKGLSLPEQIAVDERGNLYAVELDGGRVRKVDAAGGVTTVAGGGHPADGRGDGGLATKALLTNPLGVALDRTGNLYISDHFVSDNLGGLVRKVSSEGKISTVAGGGHPADGVGDGGPATEARLEGPDYIALDAGGNLFIAENSGERIRKVNPAGIITTVAGTGRIGHTGDGGPATAADLNSPVSVFVDRAGNLFFSEGDLYPVQGGDKGGNSIVREVIGVAVSG